jgi:hypothetical protein
MRKHVIRCIVTIAVVIFFGSLAAHARGNDLCPHKRFDHCYRVAWRGHEHTPWTTRENAQTILNTVRLSQNGFHDYWAERRVRRFRRARKVNLNNPEN